MRKIPVQSRAKVRVETILDAAETLILNNNISNITMERIAEVAKVSIGSLYQYFESRDEVWRQLGLRYYLQLTDLISPYLVSVQTISDFIADIQATIRICWDYTLNNPGYRALFFDVGAWEVMREVDWQDTQVNAQRIAEIIRSLLPNLVHDELFAFGMIIGDSAASTARMASRFPDMRDRLFTQFIDIVTNQLFVMIQRNAEVELERSRRKIYETVPRMAGADGIELLPATAES